ncbi:MAG TPA: prephenate dehydrogenase/arogenate dehydrogenase family protein, partial [Nitrospirae bacterium]|nr:prephenate dehydrogenase/arogenate dehydrogenase family protein [Nitrospirota bacterium]
MGEVAFNRVAIIGVGLIGASIALGIKRRGLAREVVGSGRTEENLRRAVEREILDGYSINHKEAVKGADLVVLATPVGRFVEITKDISGSLKPGSLLTDVGSVKGSIVRRIEEVVPDGVRFVGCHPIAGSERSGIDYASGDLFEGAPVVLTPTGDTAADALSRVGKFWEALGAVVTRLSPEEHDLVFALLSHLPHLVSYALVNTLSDTDPDYINLSGSGFRDTTRIVLSSPELWTEISLYNRDNLLRLIESFRKALDDIRDGLVKGDAEHL